MIDKLYYGIIEQQRIQMSYCKGVHCQNLAALRVTFSLLHFMAKNHPALLEGPEFDAFRPGPDNSVPKAQDIRHQDSFFYVYSGGPSLHKRPKNVPTKEWRRCGKATKWRKEKLGKNQNWLILYAQSIQLWSSVSGQRSASSLKIQRSRYCEHWKHEYKLNSIRGRRRPTCLKKERDQLLCQPVAHRVEERSLTGLVLGQTLAVKHVM